MKFLQKKLGYKLDKSVSLQSFPKEGKEKAKEVRRGFE